MFGTELGIVTVLFILFEIAVLPISIYKTILAKNKISEIRFLVFILVFMLYNICSGLFPDDNIHYITHFAQNLLAYSSGILVAIYFYYYITIEMDFRVNWFKPITFGVVLIISFLLSYVLTYLTTSDQSTARIIFIGFPICLAFSYTYTVYKQSKDQSFDFPVKSSYRLVFHLTYIGIICMSLFPVCVAFGDFQNIESLIVNTGFVFVALGVLYKNKEYSSSKKNSLTYSVDYELTTREKEIVGYLINGTYTYVNIGQELFITPKTVSKHASNIFKKTDTKNRADFISRYGEEQGAKL